MRTEIENNRAFPAILALHLFIVFEAEGPPPSGAKYACGTTQNEQKAGKSQRADHAVRWRSLGYRRRMLVSKFLTSRGRDNAKGKAAGGELSAVVISRRFLPLRFATIHGERQVQFWSCDVKGRFPQLLRPLVDSVISMFALLPSVRIKAQGVAQVHG